MSKQPELKGKSLAELQALLDAGTPTKSLAIRLLDEIDARRDVSAAGRKLRGTLMHLLGEIDSAEDRAVIPTSQIAQIRAVGTPGLPSFTPQRLDTSFRLPIAADASRAGRYRVALDEYIKELKASDNQGTRYSLRNGLRMSQPQQRPVLYRLEMTNTSRLLEGEEVDLIVDDGKYRGVLKTKSSTEVLVRIDQDLGEKLPRAHLRVDDTKLLVQLRDRIHEIERQPSATDPGARDDAGSSGVGQFNTALADAVLSGASVPPVAPLERAEPTAALNEFQRAAWHHALDNAISFIWGPPGCGKTLTLGQVVRTAFDAGKRTLICSNTNKAVDQLIYGICSALGKDHPALLEGQVVRLGDIADAKLAEEFGDLIDLDRIVARLAAPLRDELVAIKQRISTIQRELPLIEAVLRRFTELDELRIKCNDAFEMIEEAREARDQLFADRMAARERVEQLTAKLLRVEPGLPSSPRKIQAITDDLDSARAHCAVLDAQAFANEDRLIEAEERAAGLEDKCEDLENSLQEHDRQVCERRREELQAQLAESKETAKTIEQEIARLRSTILGGARVLGATGTRAFLTPDKMGLLDLVIIDEASMLMQPMLWAAAGLSKERVVVCGDFRQLAPIVNTDHEAIYELIGADVFEVAGLNSPDARSSRMQMLQTQYRMDRAICALISGRMYDGRLKTATEPGWLAERRSWPRPPPPFDRALTLIDTSGLRPVQRFENHSRYNEVHALLVRNIAYHLQEAGFASRPKALAVCTPYRPHAELIRELLDEESLTHVQVGTVHTFQGDERNAIVVDFPDSEPGDIGRFLKGSSPGDARLINVAMSRAQNHLIVLANLAQLDARLPSDAILRGVLFDMQSSGENVRVVPALDLMALGPPGRDLEGLEGLPELRAGGRDLQWGVFDTETFDRAFALDVARARKSIAIFSGFVSHHRVAELSAMLGKAVHEVKLRCVSKPPHLNFRHAKQTGAIAFDALERLGIIVDGRAHIHQKTVIIDQRIVWDGSLNVLSFAYRSDEIMTRKVSPVLARSVARSLAKKPKSRETALEEIAERENPPCGKCGRRTFIYEAGENSWFACEQTCNWRSFFKGSARQLIAARIDHAYGDGSELEALKSVPEVATVEYLKTAQRPYPYFGAPCRVCGSDTWLAVNRNKGSFFYGCSRYSSHDCRGSINIPAEGVRRQR